MVSLHHYVSKQDFAEIAPVIVNVLQRDFAYIFLNQS